MRLNRLMSATAIATLLAGAVQAQSETPGAQSESHGVMSAHAPAKQTEVGANGPTKVAPAGDIIETITAAGQFSILLKGLEATNLTELLKTTPDLTVFAPTDAAFSSLPAGDLDSLMAEENRAALQRLLTHHVVNARLDGTRIDNARGPVPTVAGETLQVDGVEETWRIGGAKITQADIFADNGVIHVVDKVLIPSVGAGADASASGKDAMAANASSKSGSPSNDPVNSTQAMRAARSSPDMPPQAHDQARSASQAGVMASGAIDGQLRSHGPIPDTEENRAKYGGPQSRAGKLSEPGGN